MIKINNPGIENFPFRNPEWTKPITADGRWSENDGGHFEINTSSILTKLIIEVGRTTRNYASDLFISWSAIERNLRDPNYQGGTELFGLRKDGVDHNAFIMSAIRNGYDLNSRYESFYRLDIIVKDKNVKMFFAEAEFSAHPRINSFCVEKLYRGFLRDVGYSVRPEQVYPGKISSAGNKPIYIIEPDEYNGYGLSKIETLDGEGYRCSVYNNRVYCDTFSSFLEFLASSEIKEMVPRDSFRDAVIDHLLWWCPETTAVPEGEKIPIFEFSPFDVGELLYHGSLEKRILFFIKEET